MSVAVSAATEVEEVENSPPNATPRFRGRKIVEDGAAGKLQLELLERVEDILSKLCRFSDEPNCFTMLKRKVESNVAA